MTMSKVMDGMSPSWGCDNQCNKHNTGFPALESTPELNVILLLVLFITLNPLKQTNKQYNTHKREMLSSHLIEDKTRRAYQSQSGVIRK